VSCLARIRRTRRATQPAFMPENYPYGSSDAIERVEKMVEGGDVERLSGAILARRLASFK
jgi:hypothetical protein